MLSNEKIIAALQDRNLSAIKRQTGVSIHSLCKMKAGKFQNLRINSVRLVSDYLESTGVKDAH